MKVNTNSWSYRFNSWCDGGIDCKIGRMNSCQYIRYTIKNSIGAIAAGVLALGLLGVVLFAASCILVAVVGYIALLLGPFIGYSDFLIHHGVYDLAIFGTFIGSIFAIVIGLVLTCGNDAPMNVFPDYMKPNKYIKSKPRKNKTPNVLAQHLKNWHDKVCTQVEVIDDNSSI